MGPSRSGRRRVFHLGVLPALQYCRGFRWLLRAAWHACRRRAAELEAAGVSEGEDNAFPMLPHRRPDELRIDEEQHYQLHHAHWWAHIRPCFLFDPWQELHDHAEGQVQKGLGHLCHLRDVRGHRRVVPHLSPPRCPVARGPVSGPAPRNIHRVPPCVVLGWAGVCFPGVCRSWNMSQGSVAVRRMPHQAVRPGLVRLSCKQHLSSDLCCSNYFGYLPRHAKTAGGAAHQLSTWLLREHLDCEFSSSLTLWRRCSRRYTACVIRDIVFARKK